ncbi:MAG TPA: SDR family oxidoreductase [Solirubrobacteraceae bacterium]|jgi:NAD(P)-dependent dehydrogenase (short-subunit alcohol dehydrogenase family)|nr:SDR family oxidoreductase [Solirubrobacteraceae bacterium]
MELSGRHIVVTGGAGGIGSALSRRFAEEGARAVVVADRDLAKAEAVAAEIGDGALAVEFDASREDGVTALIATAQEAAGAIDIFVSNAGVPGGGGGPVETADDELDEAWRVNVMAHVWASRALLPEMLARGEGYLINTASAAGLLTQVSSVGYSVTKHAAVALAEWMAIEYREAGIRVSCICPQGVRTPMLELAMDDAAGAAALNAGGLIEPDDVAEAVVEGIAAERLLILPHPEVAQFMALKGSDPERWIGGMRKLVRNARASAVE